MINALISLLLLGFSGVSHAIGSENGHDAVPVMRQEQVSHPISPENGWWWTAGEPGRGYIVEVQNQLVFVATFSLR